MTIKTLGPRITSWLISIMTANYFIASLLTHTIMLINILVYSNNAEENKFM